MGYNGCNDSIGEMKRINKWKKRYIIDVLWYDIYLYKISMGSDIVLYYLIPNKMGYCGEENRINVI